MAPASSWSGKKWRGGQASENHSGATVRGLQLGSHSVPGLALPRAPWAPEPLLWAAIIHRHADVLHFPDGEFEGKEGPAPPTLRVQSSHPEGPKEDPFTLFPSVLSCSVI